ncbi:MAG: FHA domain-containing protein [Planctomycetota bacterium]|nr:MAG: FHA domain-containing protein [Planctomycetota bacterium]
MVRVGQIVIIQGKEAGKKHLLDKRHVFEVGRASSSAIQLPDESVAMNHCRIYREEDNSYTLYDLNTVAGTFVNGVKIEKQTMKDGDRIQLGNVVLEFKLVNVETSTYSDDDIEGFSLDDFSDSWATNDGALHRSEQYVETAKQEGPPSLGTPSPSPTSAPSPSPSAPATTTTRGRLIVMEGEDKGKEFYIDHDGRYLVGRALEAHIKIMDIKASRAHCYIEKTNNKFYVMDNNSRNGTYVNGQKISQPTELVPGSYLKVGFTIFRFEVV